MRIENSLPRLEETRLRQFEALIGAPLPADYRAFLLAHNGGKPNPSGFRFLKSDKTYSESSVAWLYGLQDGGEYFNSLELRYRGYKGRMPATILPIGSDQGGNQICISITDVGHIYFWDHEREADLDEEENPSYDNLYFIADSFSKFLIDCFD